MDRRVQQGLQLDVQIAEIFKNLVLARVLEIGLLAVRTDGIRDVPVADLDGEVILRALVAAPMHALQHGYHLGHEVRDVIIESNPNVTPSPDSSSLFPFPFTAFCFFLLSSDSLDSKWKIDF